MALSRVHTSTKATDPAQFLLLNKYQVKHTVKWGWVMLCDTGVLGMVQSCKAWPHLNLP